MNSLTQLLACAACFGRTDDRLAQGMNAGILTLLAVIGSVLVGVAAFFIYVARRNARLARPASPDPRIQDRLGPRGFPTISQARGGTTDHPVAASRQNADLPSVKERRRSAETPRQGESPGAKRPAHPLSSHATEKGHSPRAHGRRRSRARRGGVGFPPSTPDGARTGSKRIRRGFWRFD